MSWLHKAKVITEISQFPKETYGFVYRVVHLPTGKAYIGRKNLYHTRKQKLTKKEIALLTGPGRKPTHKRVEKESDWLNYYGSNITVMGMVKEGKAPEFEKYIIQLAPNKKLLTYYETKYLFMYDVLEKPDEFFNNNILGKFYAKDLEDQ